MQISLKNKNSVKDEYIIPSQLSFQKYEETDASTATQWKYLIVHAEVRIDTEI